MVLGKLMANVGSELKFFLVKFTEAVAILVFVGFVDLWTLVMFHRHQDFVWRSTVGVASLRAAKPF